VNREQFIRNSSRCDFIEWTVASQSEGARPSKAELHRFDPGDDPVLVEVEQEEDPLRRGGSKIGLRAASQNLSIEVKGAPTGECGRDE